MLTYDQALAQILARVSTLPPADIPLPRLRGLILAEDVMATLSIPPFANSAMDGFAVRAADFQKTPVTLPIAFTASAGVAPPALPARCAAAIFTGAPIPEGADTIVPLEDTEHSDGGVTILDAGKEGQFIRAAGSDTTAGETILTAGMRLRAAEIGLLATVGRAAATAMGRPKVAVISTGDELVEPGKNLLPGQIYNTNGYVLAAQTEDAGGEVVQQIHARDTPESLREAFDAVTGADVILTSGGVSVGDFDYVKDVFGERGNIDFWRVAIRPGKPLAFGTWGKTLFFGLPGNPVSSIVTFELFVRPALRKMRGLTDVTRPIVQARLTEDARHEVGRRDYQRAVVTRESDEYFVRPLIGQGSHQLRTMTEANALLIIPADVPFLRMGETASVMLLD